MKASVSNKFQFDSEILWEDAGEGVQRQVFGYNENIMMVKVKFEKGAIGSKHSHHHTQVTYVERGIFEMCIGDEVRMIKTGDGYYVPPNVVHGVTCLKQGMLVDVFSPMREDFL